MNSNNSWFLWVGISACMLSACEKPSPLVCTRFCERVYDAEKAYAESSESTCEGLATSGLKTEEICRDECSRSWENTASNDKDDARDCLNCIMREVPEHPDWDDIDRAIHDDCRNLCIEGETFTDEWAYFYTSFHNKLDFDHEPCPPRFPPPSTGDAGVDSDTATE